MHIRYSRAPRGLSIWLASLFLATSVQVKAVAEPELPCAPEPGMTTMAYGDIYSCAISPVDDVDVFEFHGTAGETVLLTLTDRTGGYYAERR